MANIKREHGAEQPYVPLGPFKFRLPFVHYNWTFPEAAQGAILVAVPLAATAVHMDVLGASFEVAVLMVIINGLLYMLHVSLGDPIFPGWITPIIPLVTPWAIGNFAEGTDRIHAIIALQMMIAVMFLVLGATGLSKKIIQIVPLSLRCGVILGAAIAAIFSVVRPDAASRMHGVEISAIAGCIVAFTIMYSVRFALLKKQVSLFAFIGKFGLLPGIVVALIVGTVVGELPVPSINLADGILVAFPFGELIAGYTVFGIGFPSANHFVQALPMLFVAYLICFGDFITSEALLADAEKGRGDERVEYNPDRSNLIVGIRNAILAFIAPYAPLNGPIWVGGVVATCERYKQGRSEMDSLYGGMSAYIFFMAIAALFLPVVSLFRPALPVAMTITMMVTGWACGFIAINMCKTREEQGIALIMGIAIAFQSAAIGLAVGVLLHLFIGAPKPVPAVAAPAPAPAPVVAPASGDDKKST
ncbi:MAG: hypothetical protein FWD96_04450 [Defluviitaleaceae bacterium]|nr:hypothetical protein [Defluviitaleaceae bacterium]